MSEKENMLGSLDSIIFREPPDDLDENWFGTIVGTFGGYRDFFTVAQSFRNAANCLIETHKNNYYEYEILDPLLYLYRHSLELYLKALIKAHNNDCDVKKEYGHSLTKLFKQATVVVQGIGYEMPEKAQRIVAEMGEIDSASFSFRYDGDWSKGEYWIGYDNLKNDFNWFFDGLEKAYHMVSKNQGKQTGAKQ